MADLMWVLVKDREESDKRLSGLVRVVQLQIFELGRHEQYSRKDNSRVFCILKFQ